MTRSAVNSGQSSYNGTGIMEVYNGGLGQRVGWYWAVKAAGSCVMGLEDILRRNAETRELLDSLVVLHGRALRDQGQADRLDGIRQDILICFDDLCTLNDMLTSCDGEIRDEIRFLQKAKDKFKALNTRRRQLLQEREKWTQETRIDVQNDGDKSVVVDTRYRGALEQFLDVVGAGNTSLAENGLQERADDELDRKSILGAVQVLRVCHENVQQTVKQLSELLADVKKDQAFIERELKAQSARIRRETATIDNELQNLNLSRKKLLTKVGLGLPETEETSSALKFFQLTLNDRQDKQKEVELEDIATHASEFLDTKIASLQDQLTHRKNDSYQLVHSRDLWSDCTHSVKNLENRIRSALMENPEAFPVTRVRSWIKENLEELSTIVSSTDDRLLTTMVSQEREVIEKAYREIAQSSKSVESSPPKNRHSSPPFLVANKSPPKIGISEKTAQSVNNDKAESGSSTISMLKNKAQKKD